MPPGIMNKGKSVSGPKLTMSQSVLCQPIPMDVDPVAQKPSGMRKEEDFILTAYCTATEQKIIATWSAHFKIAPIQGVTTTLLPTKDSVQATTTTGQALPVAYQVGREEEPQKAAPAMPPEVEANSHKNIQGRTVKIEKC